jgi:hypothetical protein
MVRISYADVPNMGDLLNVLIARDYFNCDVENSSSLKADLSGIGSGLGEYTLTSSEKIHRKLKKKIYGKLYPKVNVWGTGFIEDKEFGYFYRKEMTFNAVRGQLTKAKVEKMLNKKLDIAIGDGGILASELIKEELPKEFEVGIIPHFKEQDHEVFTKLTNKFNNSVVIDLRDDPYEVIKAIGKCKFILSSSLHGLIVADSFHIPNHHIVVTDKLMGDGFKFDDYYSSYDLPHIFTNVVDDGIDKLTSEFIVENYKLTPEMVESKKRELTQAFPY